MHANYVHFAPYALQVMRGAAALILLACLAPYAFFSMTGLAARIHKVTDRRRHPMDEFREYQKFRRMMARG